MITVSAGSTRLLIISLEGPWKGVMNDICFVGFKPLPRTSNVHRTSGLSMLVCKHHGICFNADLPHAERYL